MPDLSVSAHLEPMLTATTSDTSPISRSRTASSSAISQKGFIDCLTPAMSTPVCHIEHRTG